MRSARWVIVGAMAVAVLCAAARAEEASVLLQEGVYEQDVAGDLDKAMAVYQKVIANAEAERRYVAEAHFRLGKCYLEKGEKEKAQAEFQAVVQHYADQRKLAEAANAELTVLVPATQTGSDVLSFGPVVEQTVEDRHFVDFDTGRVLEKTDEDPGPGMKSIMGRAKEIGADALFWLAQGWRTPCWCMATFDMGRGSWPRPDAFDSVTPDDLVGMERRLAPGISLMMVLHDPPDTMVFSTREGGLGILQTLGFTDDPKGVRIRYKMVQLAPSAESPQPRVLKTVPQALSDAVPSDLKEVTVTFDRAMMDGSCSWTGGGDTFPQLTGKPYYDSVRTTCHLPVKLQPGHVYLGRRQQPVPPELQDARRHARAPTCYSLCHGGRGRQADAHTGGPGETGAGNQRSAAREPARGHGETEDGP